MGVRGHEFSGFMWFSGFVGLELRVWCPLAALASTFREAFPDLPVVLLVAMAADKEHR
jgi:hypothetical protein